MRVVKYRTRWAWGKTSWKFFFPPAWLDVDGESKESLDDDIEDMLTNPGDIYSDKYRGLEWEVIDIEDVPRQECLKRGRELHARIEGSKQALDLLLQNRQDLSIKELESDHHE